MSKPSHQECARHLDGYSAHIEYWTPDEGDSFLMRDARAWIAKHMDSFDEGQQSQLAALDRRAAELLDQHQPETTPDVAFLRETVAIAFSDRRQAA